MSDTQGLAFPWFYRLSGLGRSDFPVSADSLEPKSRTCGDIGPFPEYAAFCKGNTHHCSFLSRL